jgi:hypothetical protein
MGLDMYLSKKRFISGDERKQLKISGIESPVDIAKVECIVEEAAYWRKANAIHGWFVTNVQENRDDCGCYDVSREQLAALLDVVEQVQADHAKAAELLPTQTGFFFGSVEYDAAYFFDLAETRRMLAEALREDEPDTAFVYQASW